MGEIKALSDSGNLVSSTYTIHATIDYGPGITVDIPVYKLTAPSVSGLNLTLNGSIPLGTGGAASSETLQLYEDITLGTSNLLIHSVGITSAPVPVGWAGLLAPYSTVVTLTRNPSNKINGNVNNTWDSSAKIFQRLVGLAFSSSSSQVN